MNQAPPRQQRRGPEYEALISCGSLVRSRDRDRGYPVSKGHTQTGSDRAGFSIKPSQGLKYILKKTSEPIPALDADFGHFVKDPDARAVPPTILLSSAYEPAHVAGLISRANRRSLTPARNSDRERAADPNRRIGDGNEDHLFGYQRAVKVYPPDRHRLTIGAKCKAASGANPRPRGEVATKRRVRRGRRPG